MKKVRIKILSLIFIALIAIAAPAASSAVVIKTTKAEESNTNNDNSTLNDDFTNTNDTTTVWNNLSAKSNKMTTFKSDKKLLVDLKKVINKLNKLNPKSDYLKAKNTVKKLGTVIEKLQSRGYDVYLDEKNLRLVVKSPNETVATNETLETPKTLAAAGGEIGGDTYFDIGKAGLDAMEAVGEIGYFLHIEDKYICFDCQEKMFRKYVNNFVDPEIHWSLVRWTIGLATEQDVRNEIADYGPENMANDILDIIGPCDDPMCPLGAADLISTIDDTPDHVHVNKIYTINTTISNKGVYKTNKFNVYFYDNYSLIGNLTIPNLDPNGTEILQFSWKPTYEGIHELMVYADAIMRYPWGEVYERFETNNWDKAQVTVIPSDMIRCTLINTREYKSSSDPNQPYMVTYTYLAEHPVLLKPSFRIPIFVFTTTNPVYSPTGFQVFYPYGAIWQFYGDSEEGPWHPCWFNPYVVCQPNITEYSVKHWAIGSGYYQYFAVKMTTVAGPWPSGILKTFLTDFWILEDY